MRVKFFPILVLTLRISYVNAGLAGMNTAQQAAMSVALRQCVRIRAVSVIRSRLVKRYRISKGFGAYIFRL